MQCFFNEGDRICVVICGRVICDEETVKDYVALCEPCAKGDKNKCVELYRRFGCHSVTGWWI